MTDIGSLPVRFFFSDTTNQDVGKQILATIKAEADRRNTVKKVKLQ